MPTLNLNRKPKTTEHKDTPMRELRRKAYNTTAWRNAREAHLKRNPLCAECLRHDRITPADQVHHIKSPFTTGKINYALLVDDNNLESICAECHGREHSSGDTRRPEEILQFLNDMLNPDITDREIDKKWGGEEEDDNQ